MCYLSLHLAMTWMIGDCVHCGGNLLITAYEDMQHSNYVHDVLLYNTTIILKGSCHFIDYYSVVNVGNLN